MIKFYCPNCKQKLGVPDNYAGHRVRCNGCGTPSIVPNAVVATPSQPAPVAAPVLQAVPVSDLPHQAMPDSPHMPSSPHMPDSPSMPPAPHMDLELGFEKPTAPSTPAPTAPPKQADELVLIPDDEPAPPPADNLEAIQAAARARNIPVSTPAKKPPRRTADTDSGDSAAAVQLAKGMGKIPLSLATAAASMLVIIILWVIIAKVTGFIIGYVVIGVPLAGAWGLTRFTENRGIMLGLLAAVIGFFGMLAGHAAVAQWVIVPMFQKDKTVSNAFNEGISRVADERAAAISDEQVNNIIADNDRMVYIAAISLIEEGQLDRERVKQMMLLDMQSLGEEAAEGLGAPVEVTPELEDAYTKTDQRLVSWNDNQRRQAVRSHLAQMMQLAGELMISHTKVGSAVTFIAAFAGSFGLLDLLWFPMGLYGAFKLAAGLNDD